MQDNNNDFNRKIEVLLLKMLLVHMKLFGRSVKKCSKGAKRKNMHL